MPWASTGRLGSFIGSPSRLLMSQPAGLLPTSAKSAPVNTASTPGMASAAEVSMLTILPFAKSERAKTAAHSPHVRMSSVYRPWPVR